MCNSLFRTGKFHLGDENKTNGTLKNLEGRLAHIHWIKSRTDRAKQHIQPKEFEASKSAQNLYRNFLRCKHFIIGSSPLIITEGKTDIVYLKCAIRSLSHKFPKLVKTQNGNKILKVRFLNPTYNNTSILNLCTGFSGMTQMIATYQKDIKKYANLEKKSPVILLVDNDKGGMDTIKKANSESAHAHTGDQYLYIFENLYLVKTPKIKGADSYMENFFLDKDLNREIDGKKLDVNKKHGDNSSLSKEIFASQIIRPNSDKIDFSGFEPILQEISNSIDHFNQ